MKRVLVVDDDDLVRTTVSSLLQSLNFQVTETASGIDALRLLSETTFNLIVTDLFMPETDGIELILKIRRISPTIPIVLITGGGKVVFPHGSGELSDLTESAKFLGASYLIYKPYKKDAFAKIIRQAVPELS